MLAYINIKGEVMTLQVKFTGNQHSPGMDLERRYSGKGKTLDLVLSLAFRKLGVAEMGGEGRNPCSLLWTNPDGTP